MDLETSNSDSESENKFVPSPGITPRMQEIILRSTGQTDRTEVLTYLDKSDTASDEESDEIRHNYSKPTRLKIISDPPLSIPFVSLKAFERTNCTICLNPFKRHDRLVRLRCRDVFHTDCYEEWSSKSYRCPKCLKTIDDYRAQLEFSRLERAIEEVSTDDEAEYITLHCIDCEIEVEERENPIKNKCRVCGSYNTTIMD